MLYELNIKLLLNIVLIVALIVAVIYLIKVLKNLVDTMKETTKILSEVETITAIAEKRSVEIDEKLDTVFTSVDDITDAIKGRESLIKQLSQIAGGVSSIVGVFKGKKEEPSKSKSKKEEKTEEK